VKSIRKYTDHVWKGYLTSYRFSFQVCCLHIIDFKIKIEDKNYKLKIKIEIKLVKAVFKILSC